MAIISFKNIEGSEIESFRVTPSAFVGADEVVAVGSVRDYISNYHIKTLIESMNFYYAPMQIVLEADADTLQFIDSINGTISATAFWKASNTTRERELDNYISTPITFRQVSLSGDKKRLVIEPDEQQVIDVKNYFRSISTSRGEYGLLLLNINFTTTLQSAPYQEYFLIKYTDNPPESINVIQPTISTEEVATVTPIIETAPVNFETLFIPTLSASFVYNHYEVDEENYESAQRKNYRGKKLLNIPRYIELRWNKAPHVDNIRYGPDPRTIDDAAEQIVRGGENVFNGLSVFFAEQPSEEGKSSAINIGGYIVPRRESVSRFMGAVQSGDSTVTKEVSQDVYDRPENTTINGRSFRADGVPQFTSPGVSVSEDDLAAAEESSRDTVFNAEIGGRLEREHPATANVLPDEIMSEHRSDYVGYSILKERFNPETDEYQPVDVIVIPGKDITSFIDWKIAYRESYRYSIRSVFRFINSKNLSMFYDKNSSLSQEELSVEYNHGFTLIPSYYFDSDSSLEFEVTTLEFKRPDPPYNVNIIPNSRKKNIWITWNQKNQNKDVIGYNIYRKNKKTDRFFRLNSSLLGRRDNFFIDKNVEYDVEYIYAIESIDIHDNRSKLSAQYFAKITLQQYFNRRYEEPIFWAEKEGLELGEQILIPEKRAFKFKKHFKLFINPLFKNLDENTIYLLKIKSLDNFLEKEIKLDFNIKRINHTIITPRSAGAAERAREVLVEESSNAFSSQLNQETRDQVDILSGKKTFNLRR